MSILSSIILYITSFILLIVPTSQYSEGIIGQPRSFLPNSLETQSDKTISSLIFRSLFKYDHKGNLVPDLADSWEVSDEGLVYTITLKENQKWADGKIITADDLLYSAFKVPALSGIATDKVNDITVRYVLPNKFSPFLSLLTGGVMQSGAVENQKHLQPTGSGAFKVISVKENGPIIKEVILYNLNPNAEIKKLLFKYYVNEDELETGAKLGEIDGFVASQEHELENFIEGKFPQFGVYYALFFNLNTPILESSEFRNSLRSALNIKQLTADYGVPTEGPISKSPYSDSSANFDYFIEDLVNENRNTSFKITVPDIPEHLALANNVKKVWEEKFGLTIELIVIDPEKVIKGVIETRDFEVLLFGQEAGRDPDRYSYWHSTQTEAPNLNITNFQHVRADKALEEGRNSTDPKERQIHYNEFQRVIEEQVPAIFLYHPFVKYFSSDFFDGMNKESVFSLTDRFSNFSKWRVVQAN